HGVVTHVADADRRVFERTIPGADRPTLLLQRPDDVFGVLALGELETRHRPTVPPFARQELHTVLGGPRFRAAPHRVVTLPARLDAAFTLDPAQLDLERVEQRD